MRKNTALGIAMAILTAVPARAAVYYVVVAGLGGEPQYEQQFTALARDLDRTFRTSTEARVQTLTDATRARMKEALGVVAVESKPEDAFVLVLIGHGSFDGYEYKFNLVGPDISGAELARLCDRIAAKRQLVVNTTSSSGGSLAALERRGRAVIAATKNGEEKNVTVFARYWVEALHDPDADLDKDGAISALEAFEYAQRKTADYYKSQNRLATEHAIFEDTGHGSAVRAASVRSGEGLMLSSLILLRLGPTEKAANTPAKRALLAKKEDLERRIDTLRYRKAAMSTDEYEQEMKQALVELARVQQELDQ